MGAASVHECPKQVKPRQLSGQWESGGSGVKMPTRERTRHVSQRRRARCLKTSEKIGWCAESM